MSAVCVEEYFLRSYGHAPEVRVSAPGRVNLMGEHTDYNGGRVLPVALPQRTHVAASRRIDRRILAKSAEQGEHAELSADEPLEGARAGSWDAYVRGVVSALGEVGYQLGGCELAIASSVPLGSGVSSSAALTVALCRAFCDLFSLSCNALQVASIAYRAEHDHVGIPIGVMDPMAVALGDETHALFLDTRTMQHSLVAMPANLELVVVDSGVRHNIGAGDYRLRREECAAAASRLEVAYLCELDPNEAQLERLPTRLQRRARHVISENARVAEAVAALRGDEAQVLGSLFNASHASQRDDFEVSVPDVDRLAECLRTQPGAYGARLTGGGFGGSVVAVVERGAGERVALAACEAYRTSSGHALPTVLLPLSELTTNR